MCHSKFFAFRHNIINIFRKNGKPKLSKFVKVPKVLKINQCSFKT
ncbi:unnamed protein product [Tenebrio molitor]|nr:unnamed protein product [Tenebrio molitor]